MLNVIKEITKKTLENTKLNMKTTHKNKNTIMLKTFFKNN